MTRGWVRRGRLSLLVLVAMTTAACASTPAPVLLVPAPEATEDALSEPFRSVWVAGFVAPARSDVDVNAELAQRLGEGLATLTTARVVPLAPIRLQEEPELLSRAEFAKVAREYPRPLVVTGTIGFNYPPRTRRVNRPGRSTDTHTLVILQLRLAFIDGASGRVIAATSYPARELDVGHGSPKVLEAFDRLFRRNAAAILQDIAFGPTDQRWTLK